MSVDGTLGSLLQGVSQQPTRVRPEGTVGAQVNYVSDIVRGLTARPALHALGRVENSVLTGLSFLDVRVGGVDYLLGYKTNTLAMWKTDGTQVTVNTENAAVLDYIGQDMRAYVFNESNEDQLFLTNRDVVVSKMASPSGAADVAIDRGLVAVLGGQYSRTYTVRLKYLDNTVAVGTYKTPNGNTAGDADKTAAGYIAEQLRASIQASATKKATTTIARFESTLLFTDATQAGYSLTVDDEDDGTTIRCFTNRVDDVTYLTETAPHGVVVRVTGNDEGISDDYYLRFKSDTTATVGLGFGDPGVWEEWFNVTQVSQLDLTTMPHVLTQTGANTFLLSRGNWLSRRVGDDTTNPFFDVVGSPVRDISGFQSRLVLVGGSSCSMSRSNRPLDFFNETALSVLATDPINISSTEAADNADIRLDWIIPFDRDLVLMADPGKGQYIISGGNKLTPANAAMVLTTAFEMRGGAKPIATGKTVLFPFKSGRFSGINEFFTNDAVATNGADPITGGVDRYVEGLVNHARCSTNFNLALFKTDAPEFNRVVWVYKYLWAQAEKVQSSWSKWVMPLPVKHFFFTGSDLVITMETAGSLPDRSTYVFAALDLDIPVDDVAEYHICLDLQYTKTASSSSTVVLPYAGARFVQSTGCFSPGSPADIFSQSAPDANGYVTYTLVATTVPSGATVVCGLPYERWVDPTMPVIRDRNGKPVPRLHLVVNGFMIDYEDTGFLRGIMSSRYRAEPIIFEVDWFNMDDDADDPASRGVRSGILHIPWGERSDWSELRLFSDDVRPTTITEVSWTGQVFKGGRE